MDDKKIHPLLLHLNIFTWGLILSMDDEQCMRFMIEMKIPDKNSINPKCETHDLLMTAVTDKRKPGWRYKCPKRY